MSLELTLKTIELLGKFEQVLSGVGVKTSVPFAVLPNYSHLIYFLYD